MIIPDVYSDCGDFHNGMSIIARGEKYRIIDKRGKEVVPLKYKYIGEFKNGMASFAFEGKYGFINEGDKNCNVKI